MQRSYLWPGPVEGSDQPGRQQHRGDREDGGEEDVRHRLREPGREEVVAEQVVGEVLGGAAERVAGELDRDQPPEDEPEVGPNETEAAREGATDGALLELDRRPGQAEQD